MIPGLAPVVSPNSPVSVGRGRGSPRVNSAGGSTGQPNHTQRGWGPTASAGGGRAGAHPGGSNMGGRSQPNASGGGMNGVAWGAAPLPLNGSQGRAPSAGRSSGSRGPDAAASTGSQRPVAVPRPGIGAAQPRPRAVASPAEKVAQNTYATMADLQALRDELLAGRLCRQCGGCDQHGPNGVDGGTQNGGSKPVLEPVRVNSPEEIARDFINAESEGWQKFCSKLATCFFWTNRANDIQLYPNDTETLLGFKKMMSPSAVPHLELLWTYRCKQTLRTVAVTNTNTRCLIAKRLRKKVLPALGIKRKNDQEGVEDPKEFFDDAELLNSYGDEEWGPDWHVDDERKWPFSSVIFSEGIFAAFVRSGMSLGVWKTRQIAFALFT
ncbi:unnamed protein product, partial [Closterium sp. Naga37s-1]